MRSALSVLVFMVMVSIAWGQQINNINPVIKIVAGEPFYIHEVKKDQTLDAIARAYA